MNFRFFMVALKAVKPHIRNRPPAWSGGARKGRRNPGPVKGSAKNGFFLILVRLAKIEPEKWTFFSFKSSGSCSLPPCSLTTAFPTLF